MIDEPATCLETLITRVLPVDRPWYATQHAARFLPLCVATLGLELQRRSAWQWRMLVLDTTAHGAVLQRDARMHSLWSGSAPAKHLLALGPRSQATRRV